MKNGCVDTAKYWGQYITNKLSDNADIQKQISCSNVVKSLLFTSYVSNMIVPVCGVHIWQEHLDSWYTLICGISSNYCNQADSIKFHLTK